MGEKRLPTEMTERFYNGEFDHLTVAEFGDSPEWIALQAEIEIREAWIDDPQ